jgi:hypothetical protein
MELTQNQKERLSDLIDTGKLTADQANVEKIKMERVHLVTCRMPAQVRRALSKAVKTGEIGHIKKDGKKPEVYYHLDFKYLVNGERSNHERKILKALRRVCI